MKFKALAPLLFFIGCLLAFGILFGAFDSVPPPGASEGKPLILIESSRYSSEPVPQGDTAISDIIEIKNIGTAPLIIQKIQTDCSCTTQQFETPQEIAPGESKEFGVEIDTTAYTGTRESKIVIHSNASNSPQVPLTIEFTSIPALVATPASLDLGNIDLSAGPLEFKIRIAVAEPFDPTTLRIDRIPEGVNLESLNHITAERSFVFDFTLEPRVTPVLIEDKFVFLIGENRSPIKLRVRFRAKAFDGLIVEPFPLSVGSFPRGSTVDGRFTLRFSEAVQGVTASVRANIGSEDPITISNVTLSERENGLYDVTFTISGNGRTSYNQAIEVTYASHEGEPLRFEVPVFGVFY